MKSFLRTFKYSLILTLVLHDLSKCTCDKSLVWTITSTLVCHIIIKSFSIVLMLARLATLVKLVQNPQIYIFPIPGGASTITTPGLSHHRSQSHRAFAGSSLSLQELSSRSILQTSPALKLNVNCWRELKALVRVHILGRKDWAEPLNVRKPWFFQLWAFMGRYPGNLSISSL